MGSSVSWARSTFTFDRSLSFSLAPRSFGSIETGAPDPRLTNTSLPSRSTASKK
jgi:hypothetical protein